MKTGMKKLWGGVLALAVVLVSACAFVPVAQAGLSFATTTRTAQMAGVVSDVGSGGKLKLYNGCTTPSGVSAATGCTLLATVTWTGTIGTATSGAVTVDTAGITQTNSTFVSGVPTFAHITTSADVVKVRIDICGSAPCWTFTGSVANGQNVTLTGLAFTAGNP